MDLGPEGRRWRLTWIYCALVSTLLDDARVVVHRTRSLSQATGNPLSHPATRHPQPRTQPRDERA